MAVRKVLDDDIFQENVFEGMKLELVMEGVINQTIAVVAHFRGEDHVLGYIPKGMLDRIEGLMSHDEKIVVSLEKKSCNRLKSAFWICIDELPDLPSFNL
jgi:hypothetical protein